MKKSFLISVFFLICSIVFAEEDISLYEKYPSYTVVKTIEADNPYDFVEMYSEKDCSSKICYVNRSNPKEYSIVFESNKKILWKSFALAYSAKSETLYFHLNANPDSTSGRDVYYDLGLYSCKKKNGSFLKENLQQYLLPENWMLSNAWKTFIEEKQDYTSFLEYVYLISDNCEKKFVVEEEGLLTDEEAVEYVYKNNLFSNHSYDFLNKYLRRIEKGIITDKSAYTLNGYPFLKDTIVHNSIYESFFITNDDGLWIVQEVKKSFKKSDSKGKDITVYIPVYYKPYLLEDADGVVVGKQPEALGNFEFYCSDDINEYKYHCASYKGYLLMRDMDGQSFWSYRKGSLEKKINYEEMISFIDSLEKNNKKKLSSLEFKLLLFCIILVLLIAVAVVILFILQSKRYEKHLLKKDKKLIFNIQNAERSKIARDLHDSVVQNIRAIRINVEMMESKNDAEDIKKQNVIRELTDSIKLLRNICYSLSPAEISLAENTSDSEVELLSIIDTLCNQFSVKTKIPCSINVDSNFTKPDFDVEVSKHVIRVIQEIFSNIEKHSFATSVKVLIGNELLEEKAMLKIVIIDDGIGCEIKDMTKSKHHFGIRNIMENMKLIEGKVEFYTKPGDGMNVILKVPCEVNNES